MTKKMTSDFLQKYMTFLTIQAVPRVCMLTLSFLCQIIKCSTTTSTMYLVHTAFSNYILKFANFGFIRFRNEFVKLFFNTSKMLAITLSELASSRSSKFNFNQNRKSLFTLVCENMPYYCVLYSGNYLLLLNACIFISTYFGSIWVHFSRNIFLSLFELTS